MNTRWVQYKNFSGYLVRGGPKISDPLDPQNHVDRAVYLAGQLEAGSWGTVQGYDGCAISGGILHNIAVSPRDESQGSFWALLHDIFLLAPSLSQGVKTGLLMAGWTVTPDGKLRSLAGDLVPARLIRKEISGSEKGNVAKTGPDSERAKRWAEQFHALLISPATYPAQFSNAAKWLAGGNSNDERAVYSFFQGWKPVDSIIGIPSTLLPEGVELAMCVYHAFSVNSPGTAQACLRPILDWLRGRQPTEAVAEEFSRRLIRSLGTRKFGNWQDDPTDGNRYDKTRLVVWRRPDLWSGPMAKRLMPKDL